jgi:uncharacterized protein YjbK
MRGRFLFAFAILALAIASAKSYTITLPEPAKAGNTELKAGDYKVEVVDQKAVIRDGKTESQVPVKVESAGSKYDTTSVLYGESNGSREIREIHIGGTTTKLIFGD